MESKRTSNACISFVLFCAVNLFPRFSAVNGVTLFTGNDKMSFRWCHGRMHEIPFSLQDLQNSSNFDLFFKHKNKAGIFANVCHLELRNQTCVSKTVACRCESTGDFRYKLLKPVTSNDAGLWLMNLFQSTGAGIQVNIDVITCPDETTFALTTQNGEEDSKTSKPRESTDDKNEEISTRDVSTLSSFTRYKETAGGELQPQFLALIIVSCSCFIMAVTLITLVSRRFIRRRRNKPTMTLESDEEGYSTYEEIRETVLTSENRRLDDDESYGHLVRKSLCEETDRTYQPLTGRPGPAACGKRWKTMLSHRDMRTEHNRPPETHPGKSDCSPASNQVFTGACFLPEDQESPYLIPVTEDKVKCQSSASRFHENQTRTSALENPYLTPVWDTKMQLCADNPYLTPVVDGK